MLDKMCSVLVSVIIKNTSINVRKYFTYKLILLFTITVSLYLCYICYKCANLHNLIFVLIFLINNQNTQYRRGPEHIGIY